MFSLFWCFSAYQGRTYVIVWLYVCTCIMYAIYFVIDIKDVWILCAMRYQLFKFHHELPIFILTSSSRKRRRDMTWTNLLYSCCFMEMQVLCLFFVKHTSVNYLWDHNKVIIYDKCKIWLESRQIYSIIINIVNHKSQNISNSTKNKWMFQHLTMWTHLIRNKSHVFLIKGELVYEPHPQNGGHRYQS